MLKKVLGLAAAPESQAADEGEDRRFDARYRFGGAPFQLRIGKIESAFRLRDLTCRGASGLADEPLAVGDFVCLELDDQHIPEGNVLWVRNTMVRLKFSRVLDPAFVKRLHAEHLAARAKEEAVETERPAA